MLDVTTPGRFRVGIDFSPVRAVSSGPRCHQEPVIQYGHGRSPRPAVRRRIARMGGSPSSRHRSAGLLPAARPLDLAAAARPARRRLLGVAARPWRRRRQHGPLLLPRARPGQRRALPRAADRAERPALGGQRRVAGRGRPLGLREPSLQGQLPDAGDPLLRLPGQLRLRPQCRLRRDGDLGDRLRALPDRAASLPARARPRSLERRHRQQPAALEPG